LFLFLNNTQLVLYVTVRKQLMSILDSTLSFSPAETIMGRTLHQRVPLKSRSTLFDFGGAQTALVSVSAVLFLVVLALYLLD
jgi:hypothetical protein